jgi:hypothetical protein
VDIATIASELRRQDAAWDDLTVDYRWEAWMRKDDGEFLRERVCNFRWMITQAGWEFLRRSRPATTAAAGGVWTEQASFDGEFYMTSDSQGVGSGSIGHQVVSFLYNSDSPRTFLDVDGLELAQPVSLAEYLATESYDARIVDEGDGLVLVEGAAPFADGGRLKLWLDPAQGYRPRAFESFYRDVLFGRYEISEYRQLPGVRGKFWFPQKATWHGWVADDGSYRARNELRVQEILLDRHPDREEFRLEFPAGALIVNEDTGENGYLTSDAKSADAPRFEGMLMTLDEHDRLAEQGRLAAPSRLSTGLRLLIGNAVLLTVIALGWYVYRVRQRSRMVK